MSVVIGQRQLTQLLEFVNFHNRKRTLIFINGMALAFTVAIPLKNGKYTLTVVIKGLEFLVIK